MTARNFGHEWQKLPKTERRKSGNPSMAALVRVCKRCGARMGPLAGPPPTEEYIVRVARQVHES